EPGISSLLTAIHRTLSPATFWDVGAHIGFYALLMLSLDENLSTVLFEPDPDQAALISETIRHAGIKNACLMQYAVTEFTGRGEFAVDRASGATGTLATHMTFNERLFGVKPNCIMVDTISLDDAVAEWHLQAPDLLKIDVEMCEHLVFRGGT